MSTDGSMSIHADEVYGEAGEHDLFGVSGLEGVHVSLAGEARCNGDEEAGAEWRCTLCGEAVTDENSAEWQTLDGFANCDQDGVAGPHDPERVPLSWVNSAGITLDESADTVSVRISVGDPRGAFVLSVEHLTYTDDEGVEHDELRLSLPSPEDGFLHMPLTALASPGYFRIGS